MRIAYATPDYCGSGHAMRGIALVEAGERAGLDVRAFGPPASFVGTRDLSGYEGSNDWQSRVLHWRPDILIGDLKPRMLDTLRIQLGVPSWLLIRIWPYEWRGAPFWDRVVAIEPGAPELGITHAIPPIVGRQRTGGGQKLRPGYNAWHEAIRYGYHDEIDWQPKGPEHEARLQVGALPSPENGADVLVRMALDVVLPPM